MINCTRKQVPRCLWDTNLLVTHDVLFIYFVSLTWGYFFPLLVERVEGKGGGRVKERDIEVKETHSFPVNVFKKWVVGDLQHEVLHFKKSCLTLINPMFYECL